jgi:putative adhesin
VQIQGDHFSWKQRLAPEQVIEVRGISGNIRADGYDGAEVEVTAEKSGRDSGQVRIVVVPNADGVTICAVYPSHRDRENTCEPGGGHMDTRDTHARVDFTVRVPRNIRFIGATVNGEVEAQKLGRRARVASVNGSVHVSTAEWAEATTVNGSIIARFGRANWPGTLHLATVNGRIELEVAGYLDAEVSTSSVNGSVDTDFPITVAGRMRRGNLRGTIGKGGRELELSTVNGDMELHKATL